MVVGDDQGCWLSMVVADSSYSDGLCWWLSVLVADGGCKWGSLGVITIGGSWWCHWGSLRVIVIDGPWWCGSVVATGGVSQR